METQFLRTDSTIAHFARQDFTTLYERLTVQETLEILRKINISEKALYFYVTDSGGKLQGVLPTRKLLMAQPETLLKDLIIRRVVTIPSTATVLEACEYFVLHRYLAFPVVDENKHILGVVDVSQFTDEVHDLAEKEQSDAVFETLGFRISQVKEAGPTRAFLFRFPWLLTTIGSGTACAILSGLFEATLAKVLVIAFFMPLVLALGESVSIQTMTVAIQSLRAVRPNWKRFWKAVRKEFFTGVLLGLACGLIVFLIVWIWSKDPLSALVIGTSVFLAILFACFLGLGIPWLLHAFRRDPRIAAGPITLACTDILAVLTYLILAKNILTES